MVPHASLLTVCVYLCVSVCHSSPAHCFSSVCVAWLSTCLLISSQVDYLAQIHLPFERSSLPDCLSCVTASQPSVRVSACTEPFNGLLSSALWSCFPVLSAYLLQNLILLSNAEVRGIRGEVRCSYVSVFCKLILSVFWFSIATNKTKTNLKATGDGKR